MITLSSKHVALEHTVYSTVISIILSGNNPKRQNFEDFQKVINKTLKLGSTQKPSHPSFLETFLDRCGRREVGEPIHTLSS